MPCPFLGGWETTGWHTLGGGLMMFVFWILVAVAIFFVVRSLNKPQDTERKDSSLKILEEEFAKNNIGEEEFLQKKRVLLENKEK